MDRATVLSGFLSGLGIGLTLGVATATASVVAGVAVSGLAVLLIVMAYYIEKRWSP